MIIPLTVTLPVTLFSRIYINIMHVPAGISTTGWSGKFKYIIAARNDLSRAAAGQTLVKATAKALCKFFWEVIFCQYRAVLQVTTNNGSES